LSVTRRENACAHELIATDLAKKGTNCIGLAYNAYTPSEMQIYSKIMPTNMVTHIYIYIYIYIIPHIPCTEIELCACKLTCGTDEKTKKTPHKNINAV
jgi:hypothetical protein